MADHSRAVFFCFVFPKGTLVVALFFFFFSFVLVLKAWDPSVYYTLFFKNRLLLLRRKFIMTKLPALNFITSKLKFSIKKNVHLLAFLSSYEAKGDKRSGIRQKTHVSVQHFEK